MSFLTVKVKKEINQLFSSFLAVINKKIFFKFLGRILGCFSTNTKEIFILDGGCDVAYLLISLFIGGESCACQGTHVEVRGQLLQMPVSSFHHGDARDGT